MRGCLQWSGYVEAICVYPLMHVSSPPPAHYHRTLLVLYSCCYILYMAHRFIPLALVLSVLLMQREELQACSFKTLTNVEITMYLIANSEPKKELHHSVSQTTNNFLPLKLFCFLFFSTMWCITRALVVDIYDL